MNQKNNEVKSAKMQKPHINKSEDIIEGNSDIKPKSDTYKKSEINKVDKKLLEILVCPETKMPLIYNKNNNELISRSAKLAYPIREGIPIMLSDQARKMSEEELGKYK